jgi:hypothetical protein
VPAPEIIINLSIAIAKIRSEVARGSRVAGVASRRSTRLAKRPTREVRRRARVRLGSSASSPARRCRAPSLRDANARTR